MGLLTKYKILFLSVAVLLAGCGKSLIKVDSSLDKSPYPMFGRIPERNFYVPITVSDSLRIAWENSAHGGFSNTSVTVYDKFVFTSDLSGRIYVFDIADGDRVGMLKSKGAIYTAPLVFRNFVIYGVAELKYNLTELIYYNYRTGKEFFNKEIYSRIMSEMIALDDGIVFLTESGRLNRYDLNGVSVWETKTNVRTHCSPALSKNIAIFGNDDGEIIAINSESGKLIYRKKYEGIFTGTVSIDDSIAYLGNNNGFIYAVKLKSGELVWKFNSGSRILMSPAIDDKNVVIGNLKGDLFSLNKFNGKLNWRNHFFGLLNATPLLTRNRIILPDLFRRLYLIDKSNGKTIKTYLLKGRTKLSPVYFDNLLFIGYDLGELRAYEFVE